MLKKVNQPEFLYAQRHLRSAWAKSVQQASVGFGAGFGPVMAGLHSASSSRVMLQTPCWAGEAWKGLRAAEAPATTKARTSKEARIGSLAMLVDFEWLDLGWVIVGIL